MPLGAFGAGQLAPGQAAGCYRTAPGYGC
jgi:hypothetical protein